MLKREKKSGARCVCVGGGGPKHVNFLNKKLKSKKKNIFFFFRGGGGGVE